MRRRPIDLAVHVTANAVSPALIAVIALASLLDLGLKVWAFIDVIPRQADQIRWHNRWVWMAIILLVNVLGPIAYLAVGRVHAPMSEEAAASLVPRPAAARAQAAVDLLYGPRHDEET